MYLEARISNEPMLQKWQKKITFQKKIIHE